MEKYLLDSNVFIEAHNRYYNDKIVPSFWEWLKSDQEIYTIKEVKDEIKAGVDNLYELIRNIKEEFTTSKNMAKISQYVYDKYDKEEEINKFLSRADSLLISAAMGKENIIIVTNETLVDNASTKVKIPNVCRHFNVKYQPDIFTILKVKKVNLSQRE